jgi:hypothetical protein
MEIAIMTQPSISKSEDKEKLVIDITDDDHEWVQRSYRSNYFIYNDIHSYFADNHIQDWLKNLDKVRGLLSDASTIYPGHGKPGNIELLESQKKYLSAYREAVKELSNNGKLTDEAKND